MEKKYQSNFALIVIKYIIIIIIIIHMTTANINRYRMNVRMCAIIYQHGELFKASFDMGSQRVLEQITKWLIVTRVDSGADLDIGPGIQRASKCSSSRQQ